VTSTGPWMRPGGQPGGGAAVGTPAAPGAWAPLARPAFRWLSVAQLAANLAIWMQTVAAQWVLTENGSSAALVALVQTAISLPVFLLAMPAACSPTWSTAGGSSWGRTSSWRRSPRP
jgi:hypothetical protein